MLKKLGLVSVGVTAGVLAAAPLASATEAPAPSDCNVVADAPGGNNFGVDRCNQVGAGNGVGNTVNGVEIPALPLPAPPEVPDFSGIASGAPSSFAVPGIPG